jgi:predicted small lipoprotein YifL
LIETQRRRKKSRAYARKFAFATLRLGGSSPRHRVPARKTKSAATVLKLLLVFALTLPATACGTKTELLMPNGKPTPRDQRDPSQPPSPISR